MKKIVFLLFFAYLVSETFCFTNLFDGLHIMPFKKVKRHGRDGTAAPLVLNDSKTETEATSPQENEDEEMETQSPLQPILPLKPILPPQPIPPSEPISPPNIVDRNDDSSPKNMNCRCIPDSTKCDGVKKDNGARWRRWDLRIVNDEDCNPNEIYCCSEKTCGQRKIFNNKNQQSEKYAHYGSYPWHAEILSQDNSFIGSGVLISPNYILTVAHKIVGLNNNFKIVFGSWNTTNKNEKVIVAMAESTKIHDGYDSESLENDIAIIKINQKLMYNIDSNINAACLPERDVLPNTQCWTAGWGKSNFIYDNYEHVLKQVSLNIISQDECEKKLKKTRLGEEFMLNKNSFICAGGEQGKDSCTGDGGGALVCKNEFDRFEVVGLTSWGIGCGELDVPGVYINVKSYLKWIEKAMNPGRKLQLNPRSMPL
ncbi:phenoloxidase-activating factor 2-like [Leptopilina boulardi]|uniref:phenoloxidase-activating factor 2-like n=1 Tax=Leptopilina boulardi TaxID=63433 RepID=UPI0021F5761E|nr:phenoloxidase-activating factor 2-like [Leptopilina boulardi]